MSERSTTPDLVELTRESIEGINRRDLDAGMSYFAAEAVWDASQIGIGTFTGVAAIRSMVSDWLATFEELTIDVPEVVDMGNGVIYGTWVLTGRVVGGGEVHQRWASAQMLCGPVVRPRLEAHLDPEDARATAERLAKERGYSPSENLDLVRSIYADWERGDWSSATWAHPDIEYVMVDEPGSHVYVGLAEMARAWRSFLSAWEDYRLQARGVPVARW